MEFFERHIVLVVPKRLARVVGRLGDLLKRLLNPTDETEEIESSGSSFDIFNNENNRELLNQLKG